uniref:Uncharacterized protein n=1 Tax=Romanomermis culicivorax TaxID=13658 RepID=A0A915L3T2_ROMCU
MLPYLRQESGMPDRKIEVKKRLKHLRQFLIDKNALIESNVVLENRRKSHTLDILDSCLMFLQQQHHFGGHSNKVKTLLRRTRSGQVSDQDHPESNCLSALFDQSLGTIFKISTASKYSDFDFQISQCFYDYLHCDDKLAKLTLNEKLKGSLKSDFPFTCVFYVRNSADSQISTACKLTFSITEDPNHSSRMIVVVNPLKKKSQSKKCLLIDSDLVTISRFPQNCSYTFQPKVDFQTERFKLLTIRSVGKGK